MSRTIQRLLVVAALLAGTVGIVIWHRQNSHEADRDLGLLNLSRDVAYVGDQSCRVCHLAISEVYERSEMARSWSVPSADLLDDADHGDSEVVDAKRNFRYRAFEEGGNCFQEEFRLDTDGNRTHHLERQVRFVVGSGSHGHSLIAEHNGFLTQLPLAWYAQDRKWELSPGYERHNQRFDRVVPLECVACHASLTRLEAGSINRYEMPLPAGIGCERCHGPGELHVAKRLQSDTTHLPAEQRDPTIVNPSRLPIDRQDDVCLQCHLISDVAVMAPKMAWTDYRPGQRLRNSRHDLFLQPEDPKRFGFSSHATRLRMSRCWSEGATRGQLTCIRCHDPHQSLTEIDPEAYVKACLACHAPADCGRDRSTTPDDANCIACHMRKGKPTNVAHTVFTDHWIRARPESLSPIDSTAPVVDPNRPIRLVDFWEGSEPSSKSLRAIALYLVVRQTGDQRQALQALDDAVASDKNNADLHFWYGVALAKEHKWRDALPHYEIAARQRDDAITGFSLGEAQRNIGRLNDAVQVLRRTIDRYPDLLESYSEIAEAYAAMGDLHMATQALDRSLDRFPYQADVQIRRAHLGYLAGEGPAQVLRQVELARQLQPDSASLCWLDGKCLADQHKVTEAINAFENALDIDDRYLPALLSLGPLLVEAGRIDDARARLDQLAAIAPNHPMLARARAELERAGRSRK